MMQPQTGTALDIPPYNTFTLRCASRAPERVLLQKSFEWRMGNSILSDNENTILISHHNTSMPLSVSELTVNDLLIGSNTYFCNVSMSVPGGNNIVAHTSGVVIVRGKVFLQCILLHMHHH